MRVVSSRFERTTTVRLRVNAAAEAIRWAWIVRCLKADVFYFEKEQS